MEKGMVDPLSGKLLQCRLILLFTTDKVWSLIYGEIFVNLEACRNEPPNETFCWLPRNSSLRRPPKKRSKEKNEFDWYIHGTNKQASLTANGITVDNLIMVRTRFILTGLKRML
jgi:hypothetical protein